MRIKSFVCALVSVCALAASQASAAEMRLARQYSMGYLQFNVMEHQQLIEKHAKALGIPDLKVSWITLNGPAAVNDALISGTIDIATGGVPGLLVLWARTKGTPQEVRGISALSSSCRGKIPWTGPTPSKSVHAQATTRPPQDLQVYKYQLRTLFPSSGCVCIGFPRISSVGR